MKVLLVFEDWQGKDHKSIYDDLDNGLTLGPFHHGTTFKAEIDLDPEDAKELETAMKNGATPVWYTLPDEDCKQEFDRLADDWENGTMHFSHTRGMKEHFAFQKLVDLGPKIIPWAMERLKKELGVFWFLILLELVDSPPDTKVNGDMREMKRRWIEWEKSL